MILTINIVSCMIRILRKAQVTGKLSNPTSFCLQGRISLCSLGTGFVDQPDLELKDPLVSAS